MPNWSILAVVIKCRDWYEDGGNVYIKNRLNGRVIILEKGSYYNAMWRVISKSTDYDQIVKYLTKKYRMSYKEVNKLLKELEKAELVKVYKIRKVKNEDSEKR